MKDRKILFLEDIISQRVRKQQELDYYAEQLKELESKMFFLRKEIQLTNFIIEAIEQEKITDLKPVLNFLSLHNFIKEQPLKRPSDMRLINNLLLEHTGYNWNQFNNNLITRDVIESNEFQEGLLKIRTHYENDGFVIEDLEASNESELSKLAKGFGEAADGVASFLDSFLLTPMERTIKRMQELGKDTKEFERVVQEMAIRKLEVETKGFESRAELGEKEKKLIWMFPFNFIYLYI